MLERIKKVMRIGHTVLDSEITKYIETARAELVRAGVDEEKAASESDALITDAIIAFVCMKLSVGKDAIYKAYAESFEYQLDNLRKSDGYKAVSADV